MDEVASIVVALGRFVGADLERAIEVASHPDRILGVGADVQVRHFCHHDDAGQRKNETAPRPGPGDRSEQRHRDDKQQRSFPVRRHDQRNDERDHRRARCAAERHECVEATEMLRVGLRRDEFPVAEHAHGKESATKHHRLDEQVVLVGLVDQQPAHHPDGDQHRPEECLARVPALSIEAQDERDQVDRQRHQPQHRNAGDVLRDVIGDREQQRRCRGRQEQPPQLQPERWR